MSDIRGYASAQRAFDAREAPEDDVPDAPEDMLCEAGWMPCPRCGLTGLEPRSYRYGCDEPCRACRGEGRVTCGGCSECAGMDDDYQEEVT